MPAAAAEAHLQVLVVADFLQVGGEQLGEGDLVQVVVLAGLQPGLHRDGGLLGELGEHVVGPEQGEGGGDDLAPRHLFVRERAVVRQADPGYLGAGDVEGELEHLGRGEPQRQFATHLLHPRPVGLFPLGQGSLVLRGCPGSRDEDPDQELSPLDRGVVAVLQDHGPLHRSGPEALG
jgi:hypothetical protein